MPEEPAPTANVTSEEHAQSPSAGVATTRAPKPRSCIICRTRKVRCDKQSPCSNCRRANVACVLPSTARSPRWARRLNPAAPTAQATDPADVGAGDRLRSLEALVRELSSQLQHARKAAASVAGSSSKGTSPATTTQNPDAEAQEDTSSVQKQFGRLVLQDDSSSRYLSSGFWSRVKDELDEMDPVQYDSDSSADDTESPYTVESERTPSERHAFLFRHNLSMHDPREIHPLPSQLPFLVNAFFENINFFMQIVHKPTVTKMVHSLRGSDMTELPSADEALLLSICYAAVISMDEEDVVANFGSSKRDLSLKYRLGLEQALAKANFLDRPDMTLVQAFAIFLCLVRRHDSPRYVWMMTGLVIRMAQYLGFQRDGTHFQHLPPYDVEMRRRIWWFVCFLDLRASEDQGTDLTIASGSFDTKIPLNINDADIDPGLTQMPIERNGVTDMCFSVINTGWCKITRDIMTQGAGAGAAGLQEQDGLLAEIYETWERGYLQHATARGNIVYWVGIVIARLVKAKMTLIVSLPVLFLSPSDSFSGEMRTKLLVSAIDVAECNHALNAEPACRQWRWIYQTYTHWHAIVYIMIEISRRPWSPIVERAWVALHSKWLIPVRSSLDKNLRMWFPLRRLMAKDRQHRDRELMRLRADSREAIRLDVEDLKIEISSSMESWTTGTSVAVFRERWRRLVNMPAGAVDDMHSSQASLPATLPAQSRGGSSRQPSTFVHNSGQTQGTSQSATPSTTSMTASSYGSAADPSDVRNMGPNFVPWLWADSDPSVNVFSDSGESSTDNAPADVEMDLEGEMDWYNWIESANGMGWDTIMP